MNKIIFTVIYSTLVIFMVFSQDLSGDSSSDNKKSLALDINQAIDYGLKNNINLTNNKLELNNKLLSLATSFNQFLPDSSVGLSIGNSYSNQSGQTNTQSNQSLNFNINTSLTLSSKMIFNIIQSSNDYNKGLITLSQAKLKLITDIKKSYYNLILLEQQLILKELELEGAKNLYDTALVQFNGNMISEIDKLKKEYSYKSLALEYEQNSINYKNTKDSFKQVLGIDSKKDIELSTNIPDLDKVFDLKQSDYKISDSLTVKSLLEDLKTSINTRNSYISLFTPSLSLGYSLSGNNNLQNTNFDLSHSLRLSLSLQLDNILPFSTNQTNIIKEQNNIKKVLNNIQNEKEIESLELQKILNNLNELRKIISSHKTNIEIADKTYDMVNRLYQSGNSNYTDFQEAKKNKFDSKLKLLNTQYEYLSNIFDLEYIINKEIVR